MNHEGTYTKLNLESKPISEETIQKAIEMLKGNEESRQNLLIEFAQFLANNGFDVKQSEYIPKGTVFIGTGEKALPNAY